MFTPEEIIAAYIWDRAYQYKEGTGIRHALLEVAAKIRQGEASEAHRHGELDDLLSEMKRRTPRKKSHGSA